MTSYPHRPASARHGTHPPHQGTASETVSQMRTAGEVTRSERQTKRIDLGP